MDNYLDIIPSELTEIILSYVAPIDLEKLSKILTTNINWGTVYYYAYGEYRKIDNYSEYRKTALLDLNNILKLGYTLEWMINLAVIYLPRKGIKEIPLQIENLLNLKSLYLSDNQIKIIPSQIGNLTNLKYLDLRNNQIKAIPCQLRELSNLEELNLAGNQVKERPRCFGDMMKRKIKLK